MRIFWIKLLFFGLLLLGIDRIAGYIFSYMSNHAKGGFVAHNHYIIDKTNEDVLVFGSSRALHHYNPNIIEDSLNTTCFNCGQEGSGIIQNYGFWTMIKEHYHPSLIIYDITDGYDLLEGEDNHYFLNWLKEFYSRKGIPEIFYSVDKTERYKMLCQMYRYNSKFHQVIGDFIYPVYKVKEKGYIPLDGEMDPMKINKNYDVNVPFSFDKLKIYYLNKLVAELGETKLVFVVSPSWYNVNIEHFKPVEKICRDNNIAFYNYSNIDGFVHNNTYFKDGLHMNSLGADEFTKMFVQDLKYK